jgi:hypothetical protein
MRQHEEGSVTKRFSTHASLTASLSAGPPVASPASFALSGRGASRGARWSGRAEISVRRGRTLQLAVERGRRTKARLELRVEERVFERRRLAISVALERLFDAASEAPPFD